MSLLDVELSPPALSFDAGEDAPLDVRSFVAHEAMNDLFSVELECKSPRVDLDVEAMGGRSAVFRIDRADEGRTFRGVIASFALVRAEPDGLSTYSLRLVPELWLSSQTRSFRIFQQLSDPDIAKEMLARMGADGAWRLSDAYKKRRYRTQYAESDYAFFARVLELAGVSFWHDTSRAGDSALSLSDAPTSAEARAPLPFIASPQGKLRKDFVTAVEIERQVLPGHYDQQDVDFRLPPERPLLVSQEAGVEVERSLRVHHYNPGALSFDASGGDTPHADDRGAQRTDLGEGARQAQKRLDAKRSEARRVRFVTTALDVRPGTVLAIEGHPHAELEAPLLVVATTLRGTSNGGWEHRCEAQRSDSPRRPPLRTPQPRTRGVETATVVGPKGEEIHTDEFGRIRVHFHWDREGAADETASLWVPVNQPWGGTGFGAVNLPRIGQEVLVDFLDGDPDRPIVIGRVFTRTNPNPYALPGFKNLQGLRSESTPKLPLGVTRSGMIGGKPAGGGDGGGEANGQSSPLGFGLPFSLDQIASLLSGSKFFGAASPNAQTHAWQGSELAMHDPQGQEQVYLQAQKDLHSVVKNHEKTVIGHSRAETIGTDNIASVGNKDQFRIASDRSGNVGASQSVMVQNVVYRESGANMLYATHTTYGSTATDTVYAADQVFGSEAKWHVFDSSVETILKCGASTIVIRPDGVSINTPKLMINKGITPEQAETLSSLAELEAAEAHAAEMQRGREELMKNYYRQTPNAASLKNRLSGFSGLSEAEKNQLVQDEMARRYPSRKP